MNVNPDELWTLWQPTFRLVRLRMEGADPAEIEDVVSEAFVRVLRADPALDDRPHALQNYLFTVACNLVTDLRRREARARLVPLDAVDGERGRVSVGSDRHVAVLDLRGALGDVRERCRASVWATAEGYQMSEVGTRLGTTAQGVKGMNTRTYRALRGVLAGER